MKILWIIIFILLTGCAATPSATSLEQEELDSIAFTNWVNCESTLMFHGYIVYHFDHEHTQWGTIKGMPRRLAVQSDLYRNDCRWVLGDNWMK